VGSITSSNGLLHLLPPYLTHTSLSDWLLHLISPTDILFQQCSLLVLSLLLLLLAVRLLRSGPSLFVAQHTPRPSDHPVAHSGVSTQCQNTIIAVAASSQSECLNPGGLLQIFVQGTTNSVVTPVDNWLKGLCARGPCSNDDIAAIVTNITSGCATDLQPALGNASPGSLTPLVQQLYPTVRKGICLAE